MKIEIDASDVGKAKTELDKLSSSVENLEGSTQKSTRTFLEAQKEMAALGTASRETSKAVDEVKTALDDSAKQLKNVNDSLKETSAAQNKAMYSYNKAALAEEAAREKAVKTRIENEKKKAALEKLLETIDKTGKAINTLDKQELELEKHFKAGRLEIDTYNSALSKIQAKRNALTDIKKEAKNTTLEINKLNKAVKILSGLLVTGFAGYSVVNFGKSIIDTNLQLEKVKTILENATGSAGKAAKELDFVMDVSNKLNIELIGAANGYSRLVAAAKGSPELGDKVQSMFEGVSEAASVLKLDSHEVNNILTNYEQMISKGKIDLTDLKQIANFIPGTLEKAANGLGTTTTQMTAWISKGLIPANEFLPRFSEELHRAFGESAQQASQGLQGQLNALTNAWTALKEEAGNAGFVDTFRDAVKGLTDVLKDPELKDGLKDLLEGLSEVAKLTLKTAAKTGSFSKFIYKSVTSNGETINNKEDYAISLAKSNILKERIDNNDKKIQNGSSFFYNVDNLKIVNENMKKELGEMLKSQQDFIDKQADIENERADKTTKEKDPLIEKYQDTKTKLAEAQKQLDDQMKSGNDNIDVNLADQKDLYQKNLDELQVEIQSKYDGLLKEQDSQSAQLQGLQSQYARYAANLTTQQKEAILSQITQIKAYLAELDKTIGEFKPFALVTNKPFKPIEKPKKTRKAGKSAAQRKQERNEKWVEGLEKQKNTKDLNKADALAYEIVQRKLTGALLDRANAVKKVYEEEQKLNNAKNNEEIKTKILSLENYDLVAQLREIDKTYKEAVKRFTKEKNHEGIELSKELFNKQKFKVQVDAVQGQIDKFYNNMHIQEQSIEAQVQAGLISRYEGQKRLIELHKQTASVIEKSLPALEKLAQQPGAMGELAKQKLTEVQTQLLLLKTTVNELENAFRNGLQEGMQSSIDGLVKGTMDLNEAVKNLFETIASNMLNQAVQNVTSPITDNLFSGLKSVGGMFGMQSDDSETQSPQAIAISSASEQGALAMQTGIEQGGEIAAQTMASAISSMGSIGQIGQIGGEKGIFEDVASHSQEAISGIQKVQAAKTAADTSMAASAASATASTTATTTAAATAATTAWTPAAAASSVASFGSAAAIGLAALMMVLTAAKAFKTGGEVSGAGTGTSDSIPAWLSNGEFVTRSAVVKQPGMLSFLNDINKRGWGAVYDIPAVRHATGGLAGVPAPNVSSPELPILKNGLAENNRSTTLKNNQMFVLSDDPQRIINTAFGEKGMEVLQVEISKNPQKFKSSMEIS